MISNLIRVLKKESNYNFLFCLVFVFFLLSIFNFITENKLISFYTWPNFSDNYFYGILFFSIILIFLKFFFSNEKIIISLNNFEKIFLGLIFYFLFLETFIFENYYLLSKEFLGIYVSYKTLDIILNNKNEILLAKYLRNIFFILFSCFFIVYFSFHYYDIQFSFINYKSLTLGRNYFYNFCIASVIFLAFKKRPLYFLVVYIFLFFLTKYSYQRGDLICFIIIPILIICSFKIKNKFKIYISLIHFVVLILFFGSDLIKFYQNTFLDESQIKKILELKKTKEIHGDLDSTITRINQLKYEYQRLKSNYVLGIGYTNLKKPFKNFNDKSCECAIFYPLISYGIFAFFTIILLFILVLKKSIKQKKLNFFFQFSILSIVYLSLFSHYPAWIGFGIYYVYKK